MYKFKLLQNKIFILSALTIVFVAIGLTSSYVLTPSHGKTVAAHASTDISVEIKDGKVTPSQLLIHPGQTVIFNTKDGLKHEFALGDGGANHTHHEGDNTYESGTFGAGEAWRVTFSQAGTFVFHDHLHPNISFLVVVYK